MQQTQGNPSEKEKKGAPTMASEEKYFIPWMGNGEREVQLSFNDMQWLVGANRAGKGRS